MSTGKKMQRLMMALGFTSFEQVAALVGVGVGRVKEVDRGSCPFPQCWLDIAGDRGVPRRWIMTGRGPMLLTMSEAVQPPAAVSDPGTTPDEPAAAPTVTSCPPSPIPPQWRPDRPASLDTPAILRFLAESMEVAYDLFSGRTHAEVAEYMRQDLQSLTLNAADDQAPYRIMAAAAALMPR